MAAPSIHDAALHNNFNAIEEYISHGGDVNLKDQFGYTMLHLTSDLKIAEMLLKAGAKIDARHDAEDTPLIHHARIPDCKPELIKFLIAHGANVNTKNMYDTTPLHATSDPVIAEILLAAGAKIDEKNNCGYTPLSSHLSSPVCTPELVKVLLNHGANVNSKNPCSVTPLHNVLNPECAILLLEAGATIDVKNDFKLTPKESLAKFAEEPNLSDDLRENCKKTVRILELYEKYPASILHIMLIGDELDPEFCDKFTYAQENIFSTLTRSMFFAEAVRRIARGDQDPAAGPAARP